MAVTETVHNSPSSLEATESGLRRLSQTLADAPLVFDLEGADEAAPSRPNSAIRSRTTSSLACGGSTHLYWR